MATPSPGDTSRTLALGSLAPAPVARVARVQASQAIGRQQPPPDGPVDRAGAVRREKVLGQGNGQDLIRPQARVGPAVRSRRRGGIPSANQKSSLKRRATCHASDSSSRALALSRRASRGAPRCRAACQSALTSTGRPRRGVTGSPSTTESIQVSAMPACHRRAARPAPRIPGRFPAGTPRESSGRCREAATAGSGCGAPARTTRPPE